MEETALERAPSTTRIARQRRVRLLVFVLMGVVGAGWLSVVAVRVVNVARYGRELAGVVYPSPPDVAGVYAVATRPHPSWGGTLLFTPEMPLTVDGAGSGPARLRIDARDFLAGTTRRDEPVRTVRMSIYGPPGSWPTHGGHPLRFVADGETLQLESIEHQYQRDTWGLKEQDRLDFDVPTGFFVRMATAKQVTGLIDDEAFTLTADELIALRDFAAYLRPGVDVRPAK